MIHSVTEYTEFTKPFFFYFQKAWQFHSTRVYDSKFAHKNYAFSKLIFTKLTSIQQSYK